MNFCYRHRKLVSVVTGAALVLGMAVPPASAVYDPTTGRWMSADPNGTGVVLQPNLPYHAANPTVTVSMAYELQYGDGMSLYEFLRSNPPNGTDPAGLLTLPDLLSRTALFGAMVGGSLGWMRSYATFSDEGSKWKQAGAFFLGAGVGSFTATGMGLLAGAIAGYGGVSLGTAIASVGIMTSPPALGLAVAEYEAAETYGERLMAGIDIGLAGFGLVASHAAVFPGALSLGRVRVDVPKSRWPEAVQHIEDAQRSGHPQVLTIDRAGTGMRRAQALRGRAKVPGKDLDEYPPAMFKEGGEGASVRPIPPGQNRAVGAYLGKQLQGHPDGTKVSIEITP